MGRRRVFSREFKTDAVRLVLERGVSAPVTPAARLPRLTVDEAMGYRRDVERLLQHGSMAERKELLRTYIAEMKLAPERREVEITYRVPEPFMKEVVAGAGFEPATFGL